jgi:hypothetical protein
MRYEIDENENYAIRIWHDGENAPAIYQPTWPDGTAWTSHEEAEAWAQLKVREFDPNWTIAAGLSPSQPSTTRPTKEEQIEQALSYLGVSIDDLKQVLGL